MRLWCCTDWEPCSPSAHRPGCLSRSAVSVWCWKCRRFPIEWLVFSPCREAEDAGFGDCREWQQPQQQPVKEEGQTHWPRRSRSRQAVDTSCSDFSITGSPVGKVLPSLNGEDLSPLVSPFWKCPHRHTGMCLLVMSTSCSSSLSRLVITSYEHIITGLNWQNWVYTKNAMEWTPYSWTGVMAPLPKCSIQSSRTHIPKPGMVIHNYNPSTTEANPGACWPRIPM